MANRWDLTYNQSEGEARRELRVQDPNSAWYAQRPQWGLIEDLMEGSIRMRSRHRRYLPQEPREIDESYDNRLFRSVCPPIYQRIERLLAGMLCRKPVRLEDTADVLVEQLFNVDQCGNDLNVWLYEFARVAIRYGAAGVLVDAPINGGRPYWATYSPRDILGWRQEPDGDEMVLTQLRLSETLTIPHGDYGEEEAHQIRVLRPGSFEVHRKDERGNYVLLEEESGTTAADRIPFSMAFSNKVAPMVGMPPLHDIAELNLKAYQVQSDLDNQLHLAAVPMLAFFGFPTAAEEVSVGPGEALSFPAEGRAEYIEPAGTSYDYQFRRLQQIEDQANKLGMAAVLGQKLGAETAEAKRIDRSQGDSTLQVLAQSLQDAVDNSLRFHAAMLGGSVAPGSAQINRDFVSARLDPAEIKALQDLFTAGSITLETLLQRLADGEVLGDDFDVEAEVDQLDDEGQAPPPAAPPIPPGELPDVQPPPVPSDDDAASDVP